MSAWSSEVPMEAGLWWRRSGRQGDPRMTKIIMKGGRPWSDILFYVDVWHVRETRRQEKRCKVEWQRAVPPREDA